MKINIAGKETYVPKWNGNRKLPKEEQVVVEYRYMTCEEEERFQAFVPRYDTENTKSVELEIQTHANDIWAACVTKLTGLSDTAGKEITDPKAVAKVPGVYGLVTEVVAEIKRGLDEGASKN